MAHARKHRPTRSAVQRVLRGLWSASVAWAACSSAQAQTDYSYYGVLDLSYGRFEPAGLYREHRFNSNSLTASFIGVNLKREFDDGWTPGLTLETFLRFQDWRTGRNNNDPFLSRNAFVSLGSRYGTLRAGRLQTYLFDATTRFNALGNSIAFSPAIRHLFASGNLEGVQGDFYWDRAVSYSSPSVQGVSANVMFAQGPSSRRGDYGGGSLIGSFGLLGVELAAQRVHVNDGLADPTVESAWQLGATYNLGFARVFGQYSRTRDGGLEVRSHIATAGLAVPLGPGNVLVQIGRTLASGPAVDRKHTSTSAAYQYAYDSTTDLYVVAMDDRIRNQTKGLSVAAGVRLRF